MSDTFIKYSWTDEPENYEFFDSIEECIEEGYEQMCLKEGHNTIYKHTCRDIPLESIIKNYYTEDFLNNLADRVYEAWGIEDFNLGVDKDELTQEIIKFIEPKYTQKYFEVLSESYSIEVNIKEYPNSDITYNEVTKWTPYVR